MNSEKLLLIVDMQNDFLLEEGALNLGHNTDELRKNVAEFAKDFPGHIFLTQDTHQSNSCEFNLLPKHCIHKEPGWDVVNEIKEAVAGKKTHFIEKASFSGSNVINILSAWTKDTFHSNRRPEIHVVGVCTHICISETVAGLVNRTKEKYNFIPDIIIHKNMIDDFDKEMSEMALKRMKNLYGVEIL